ncbi:hypothetical protein CRM22_004697 [Opisthorchis felineus]|uniref:Kelch repeat protein n=1 Tax=Opisthorchis felineus TaxID=147828 RepID=A0A4S2LUX1_OPIFE|nr:hypothetical protein CRM22_004697 [Opisthorchis felineus]
MLAPLQWIVKDGACGPYLQDHAGGIVGDYLYIHGGVNISRTSTKNPCNGLFRIKVSPEIGVWTDLTSKESPALSQHACIGFLNRYLIFIGGWTGQIRTPGIHTYDVESQKWLPPALCEPLLKGFPQGAGLSAHTATEMKSIGPKNTFSAFIIGREGSLRMQRRSGNIYLLYGNLPGGDGSPSGAARYIYCEASPQLSASSRSYHSSTALSTNTLVTLGGRSDHPVELVSWSRSKDRRPSTTDWPGDLVFPRGRCPLVSSLIQDIRLNKLSTARSSSSNQSCSRGHSAIPGDGGVLVTGGDGFNALVRDPLDSAYAFVYNDTEKKGVLYNVGKLLNPRAYAVYGVHEIDGTAWLYGGTGPGGKAQNTLLKLERLQADGEDQSESNTQKH